MGKEIACLLIVACCAFAVGYYAAYIRRYKQGYRAACDQLVNTFKDEKKGYVKGYKDGSDYVISLIK